jgi:hypothetical protein
MNTSYNVALNSVDPHVINGLGGADNIAVMTSHCTVTFVATAAAAAAQVAVAAIKRMVVTVCLPFTWIGHQTVQQHWKTFVACRPYITYSVTVRPIARGNKKRYYKPQTNSFRWAWAAVSR